MRIRILLNALLYGDAVSTHCILLKQRAEECGLTAFIHAPHSEPEVARHVTPVENLSLHADGRDVLLHQFFNETALMPYVEKFPGRRVLMYHNITPPEWFPAGSPVRESCERGLQTLRQSSRLYEVALGMSEFSRAALDQAGYPQTGVFPLFVDVERLRQLKPNPIVLGQPLAGPSILSVGRIAPNKKIEDLFRLQAACLQRETSVVLTLVGDDRQHPAYTAELRRIARSLGLAEGVNFQFTGKIPEDQLAAHYARASVFVSMSEHEGFCAPLLEAMAFDVPVFAYDNGASSETLGSAGFVFKDKGDFPALASRILEVTEREEIREGAKARQRDRLKDFSAARQRCVLQTLLDSVQKPREAAARTQEGPAPPKPAVSVVISTYNRATQLERCLESLARQTYRNFEVVVVNGPSPDHTESVVRAFGEGIALARTDSLILCVSRNVGISKSRGELVALIDDDAVADPEWLQSLVGMFADERVGAAGGLVFRMDARQIEFRNGVIDRRGVVNWDISSPGTFRSWKDDCLNTVSGNNCMFRRDVLCDIGGFDERIEYYHDEADVVIRIANLGFLIEHCPDAIVYHEAAASHNRKSPYDINWLAVYKNTLYCALKNSERAPWLAARIVGWLWTYRIRTPLNARLSGRITTLRFLQIVGQCMAGTAKGLSQGLWARPIYGSIAKCEKSGAAAITRFAAERAKRLSVCLITQHLPTSSFGGIATYTMALAQGLRDLGCAVHVLSRDAGAPDHCRDGIWFHPVSSEEFPDAGEIPDGLPILRKNLDHANGVRLKLNDLLARWDIDLVESPNWDAEGVLCAVEHRVPIVVRVHSPLFKVIETQRWQPSSDLDACCELEGLLLDQADAVSGSTQAVLKLVDERYGLAVDRTALIPLGIETRRGSAGAASNGVVKVLFVGRLEARKGIQTFLAAIPAVVAQEPDVAFDIVGAQTPKDGTVDAWRKRTNADIARRVTFHGEVDNAEVDRFYESCDMFVAPSAYESFGLVFLEAMARGKPVIGTAAGGIPEVVRDGVDGFLVPPGDAAALATTMVRLIRDPGLRTRMGTMALESYRARFSQKCMAERSMEFYSDVIAEWRAANPAVWAGGPLEMRRGPSTTVAWISQGGSLSVTAAAGSPGVVVYGPYIRLDPGSYRAEYYLWVGAAPVTEAPLITIDVYSDAAGFEAGRTLDSTAFAAGPGTVADVYFEVPSHPARDYEFRVHTTGAVPVHVKAIRVCRWPAIRPGFSQQPRPWQRPANPQSTVESDKAI